MPKSARRKKPARSDKAKSRPIADDPAELDVGESLDFSIREAGSGPSEAVRGYLHLHYGSGIIVKKVNQHLAQWGLSVSRYSILRLLLNRDAMALSELSKSHVCVAGNITSLVDRLERDGLVRRVSDPDDKRVTRVLLTTKGRTITASAIEPHRRFLENLMNPLGVAQIRNLAQAVDLLARQAGRLNPSEDGLKRET
jgi:DNA-binding MarR family transcriptional regulator